jgi:hypothetical protein
MTLLPIAAALLLYALMGSQWLNILFFAFMGPLFWLVFGRIGAKLNKLRQSLATGEYDPIPCLMVNGILQSPGIALLKKDELVFEPLVGDRVSIHTSQVTSFREVRWFNGKLLWFKKGFWLKVEGRSRLGVALPASCASLLKERLG